MRLVFAGTPELARAVLASLLHSSHEIIAVYTQPDRPSGRGLMLAPSPVKQLAEAAGLPVYQPLHLKAETTLPTLSCDVMVVVAYGLILPPEILALPKYGCLNVHLSLLPRWRGAAPIQRALEAGDAVTGVSIMKMDAGLDTGPLYLQKPLAITEQMNAASLHDVLAELGSRALLEVLAGLEADKMVAHPQATTGMTYAKKLHKEEAEIDWQKSARAVVNQIRAFNPWPVAQTTIANQRLRIWEAEVVADQRDAEVGTLLQSKSLLIKAGKDAVRLDKVQLPGGKIMSGEALLHGHQEWITRHR